MKLLKAIESAMKYQKCDESSFTHVSDCQGSSPRRSESLWLKKCTKKLERRATDGRVHCPQHEERNSRSDSHKALHLGLKRPPSFSSRTRTIILNTNEAVCRRRRLHMRL